MSAPPSPPANVSFRTAIWFVELPVGEGPGLSVGDDVEVDLNGLSEIWLGLTLGRSRQVAMHLGEDRLPVGTTAALHGRGCRIADTHIPSGGRRVGALRRKSRNSHCHGDHNASDEPHGWLRFARC